MCHEQWALTVIKLLRFFCINICCFSTRFYIFCTTVTQSSKFHENYGCFWSLHPRTFTVRLAVTTKYQGSGFAAELQRCCLDATTQETGTTLGKSRPNRSHRKRSYSIPNIGNMMGCDHQSCVPVSPFAGELWRHFEYVPTTTVRQLLIFDHMTVIAVLTCCCIPNFIKIGLRVRPPDAHNCRMFISQVASHSVHWYIGELWH